MNNKQSFFLEVKDHSVSGEFFRLVKNEANEMLVTQPQPSVEQLPQYYKSENYISHTDTKRNLLEFVYHMVSSIALKRKVKLISDFNTPKKTLLDVGCGTGDFLKMAFKAGWSITGIEPNESARAIANTKTNGYVYDVPKIKSLTQNTFQVITLWHVLEHLPNLEDSILDFKRLLHHEGQLVIAVPNYKSYDAEYYKSFWAAYDAPRHLWHFSPKSIELLFGSYGFKVEKRLPMYFDAYYVSLLSEKYKSGKMNFMKAFKTGWVSNKKAKHTGNYSSLIYVLKKQQ